MAEDKQNPTVNIDGTNYEVDQLSEKARHMIGFIQRLDKEAGELRYQLDKAGLARKQTIFDLKDEVESA